MEDLGARLPPETWSRSCPRSRVETMLQEPRWLDSARPGDRKPRCAGGGDNPAGPRALQRSPMRLSPHARLHAMGRTGGQGIDSGVAMLIIARAQPRSRGSQRQLGRHAHQVMIELHDHLTRGSRF